MQKKIMLIAATLCLLATLGCRRDGDYTPKPQAFLRFSFPEKDYVTCDTAALPFTFERASEARIRMKRDTPRDKWVDILYPSRHAVVFLSYKPLRGPQGLAGQVDTSYGLLKMHFDHSSGVDERQYYDPTRHLLATTYRLKGGKVASTYQFWATDSNSHFLRGSLYLDHTPNNDSLAPLIDYLQQDLDHLVETLEWR